jgi:hypothetical protein
MDAARIGNNRAEVCNFPLVSDRKVEPLSILQIPVHSNGVSVSLLAHVHDGESKLASDSHPY